MTLRGLPQAPFILIGLIGTLALALSVAAPSGVIADTTAAYFRVAFDGRRDTFVVRIHDAAVMEEARADLLRPREERRGVMGIIVKEGRAWNPGWSYHLDPETISLFELAIEVCDGNPQYIEEHLDEVCGALLPDCRWCPWGSYIIEELPASWPGGRVHLPWLARLDAR